MEREPRLAPIPLTDFNQPLLVSVDKTTNNYGSDSIPLRTLKQILPRPFDDRSSSIQADDQNTFPEHQSLGGDARGMYHFLEQLRITRQHIENVNIPKAALFKLYQKEFSSTSWLKWSSLDHLVEKYLQWPLLSPADVGQETQLACDYRVRPHERSILLKTTWGLMKAYAIRGFVQGLEMGLLQSVHYFIYGMLAYRLEELLQTGQSDFDEFQAVFSGSSQKGIDSLVQSLAHIDATWLRLILAAPVILGVIQGLLKMRGAHFASTWEREAVLDEIDVFLSQPSSLCRDMSNFLAFSNSMQKLEQWVRWDGRLYQENRWQAFEWIRRAAHESGTITQPTAMKSLAKIAHGIGFKDLPQLQQAGYSRAELTDLLYIKASALADLEILSQPSAMTHFLASLPRRIYASYLLWWLGQSTSVWKQQLPFILFKTVKLGLEVLFLQKIAASILEAIRCPDKPGYQFGNGYADWASDYTATCFTTRISLFRTIDPDESVDDLVAEIPQYHLTDLTTLNLYNKYLTTEEATQIIQAVVQQGATLKTLRLSLNYINTLNSAMLSGLSQLIVLDLSDNSLSVLSDDVFSRLSQLTTLVLGRNKLSVLSEDVFSELRQLAALDLSFNQPSVLNNSVFSRLNQLTTLDLTGNQLRVLNDGVFSGLSQLTVLYLSENQLDVLNDGVLSELSQLTSLYLRYNQLSVLNNGVFSGLSQLTNLDLSYNQLSVLNDGVLSKLSQLQQLALGSNYLNTSMIMNILSSMPVTLTDLDISSNRISDLPKNFSTLLPIRIKSLFIGDNSFISSTLTREFMQYFPFRLTEFSIASSFIVNITEDSFTDFSSLEFLDLSDNQLKILSEDVFSGLSQLTSLNLGRNQLSALNEGVFSGISQLTSLDLEANQLNVLKESIFSELSQLTTLALNENNLNVLDEGIFSGVSQLTTLALGGNNLSVLSEGVFNGLNQLTDLYLYGNYLSVLNDGIFSGLSQLTTLYLIDNQLSVLSEGVFSRLSQLKTLLLSVNQLNDTAIKNITKNFPYQLNTLYLDANSIGNEGMLALAEILPCTSLIHISLSGNPANDTSVALAAQQNTLKKVCDDQRCHANLPASESCGITTNAMAAAKITWGSGNSIEIIDEDAMKLDSPDDFYWPHSAETAAFQSPITLSSGDLAEPASTSLTSGEVSAVILGVVSLGILLYKKSTWWIPAIINTGNYLFQRCCSHERRETGRTTFLAQSSNRHGLFTSLPSTMQQSSTLARPPISLYAENESLISQSRSQ